MQTTSSDFGASGAAASGAMVTQQGDGEVTLAGALYDPFNGPTLDANNWRSGSWSGGTYTPSFSNGELLVAGTNGAWVRSKSSYSSGNLDGVVTFGAGPWQHFGFGANNFDGNVYQIFSTYNTSNRLYARSNNNGSELRTDLGPLDGLPHRYRIEVTAFGSNQDQVNYYIDGVLVASHTIRSVPPIYVYLSQNSGAASPALRANQVALSPPYVASGAYTSAALDAGQSVNWTSVSWQASLPAGTGMTIQARTSADGVNWSAWQAVSTSGASLALPAGRYAQYQASFTTSDTQAAPALSWIAVNYGGAVAPPPALASLVSQNRQSEYTTVIVPDAKAQPLWTGRQFIPLSGGIR